MKRFISLAFCFTITISHSLAQICIVDAYDKSPISAASVFDHKGNMVGFTWDDGILSNIPESAYPISIRSMGYEPITIESSAKKTWEMESTSYGLSEIVIVPVKRDILRQTFYIREYFSMTTSKDTITIFTESMADRFVPTDKKSKFKGDKQLRTLTSRNHSRISIGSKDSLMHGEKSIFPSMLSLVEIDDTPVQAPESFLEENTKGKYYEEQGKHGATTIMRQKGETFSYINDALAIMKDHTWTPWPLKLLGCTLTINQMYFSQGYRANDEGIYFPKDLNEAAFCMEAKGSGKVIQKIFDSPETASIRTMVELYVTDNDFLTIEEAKQERKITPSGVQIKVPHTIPPLGKATQQIIMPETE